jgi:tetratricopeptide (TPR) repeat protein
VSESKHFSSRDSTGTTFMLLRASLWARGARGLFRGVHGSAEGPHRPDRPPEAKVLAGLITEGNSHELGNRLKHQPPERADSLVLQAFRLLASRQVPTVLLERALKDAKDCCSPPAAPFLDLTLLSLASSLGELSNAQLLARDIVRGSATHGSAQATATALWLLAEAHSRAVGSFGGTEAVMRALSRASSILSSADEAVEPPWAVEYCANLRSAAATVVVPPLVSEGQSSEALQALEWLGAGSTPQSKSRWLDLRVQAGDQLKWEDFWEAGEGRLLPPLHLPLTRWMASAGCAREVLQRLGVANDPSSDPSRLHCSVAAARRLVECMALSGMSWPRDSHAVTVRQAGEVLGPDVAAHAVTSLCQFYSTTGRLAESHQLLDRLSIGPSMRWNEALEWVRAAEGSIPERLAAQPLSATGVIRKRLHLLSYSASPEELEKTLQVFLREEGRPGATEFAALLRANASGRQVERTRLVFCRAVLAEVSPWSVLHEMESELRLSLDSDWSGLAFARECLRGLLDDLSWSLDKPSVLRYGLRSPAHREESEGASATRSNWVWATGHSGVRRDQYRSPEVPRRSVDRLCRELCLDPSRAVELSAQEGMDGAFGVALGLRLARSFQRGECSADTALAVLQGVTENVGGPWGVYTPLSSAFIGGGMTDRARAVVEVARANGLTVTERVLSDLARGFAVESRMDKALEMLRCAEAHGIVPSEIMLGVLFDGYSRAGDVRGMEALQKWMTRHGLELTDWHTTSMLYGYAQAGDCDKALELLETQLESERAWGIALHAHAKQVDVGGAEKTFARAMDRGIRPTPFMLTALADAYSRAGSALGAERVVNMALQSYPESVTLPLVHAVLKALAQTGDAVGAEGMLEKCWELHLSPTADTYALVVAALATSQDMPRVVQLLDDCQRRGVAPNARLFNAVLRGYVMQGTIEGLQWVLERMRLAHVRPDIVTFSMIAKLYVRLGDLDGAESVLDRAARSGVRADKELYSIVLRACAEARAVGRFTRVREAMTLHGFSATDVEQATQVAERR